MARFAIKLTRTPGAMEPADLAVLREQGFEEEAISCATQVVAYFNYINRVADALGVDLEEWMTPHPHGDRAHREDPA